MALIGVAIVVGACGQVTDENATLVQRVCGVTLANPARWMRSMQKTHQRDPKWEVGLIDHQIVVKDCIRSNVYDFAASGLPEASISLAARAECADMERNYFSASYSEYYDNLKPEDRSTEETREQSDAQLKGALDEVAHNAYVEARAGQCWAHRMWKPVSYEPGI